LDLASYNKFVDYNEHSVQYSYCTSFRLFRVLSIIALTMRLAMQKLIGFI